MIRFTLFHTGCGYGPRKSAEYLMLELQTRGHDCALCSLEPLLPSLLTRLLFTTYREWCYREKQRYALLYNSQWVYRLLYAALRLSHCFYLPKLETEELLRDADTIVATSFYPAFFADILRRQLQCCVRVVGIINDYGVSPAWLLPLDFFFVPNETSRQKLVDHGIVSEIIAATGIPLPPSHRVGLSSIKPCDILVTGGGWGLGPIPMVTASILDQPAISLVRVLCGNNKSLRTSLESKFQSAIINGRLEVLGEVKDMVPYYWRTRILMTKPGGLTIAEAAAFGVPIVLMDGLPGQEQTNARVLRGAKACIYLSAPACAGTVVCDLLNSPSICSRLTSNARKLVNIRSTADIADLLENV